MSAPAIVELEEKRAVAMVEFAALEEGSHGVNVTVAVMIVPVGGAGSGSGWLGHAAYQSSLLSRQAHHGAQSQPAFIAFGKDS